jgi:hypothetical protein
MTGRFFISFEACSCLLTDLDHFPKLMHQPFDDVDDLRISFLHSSASPLFSTRLHRTQDLSPCSWQAGLSVANSEAFMSLYVFSVFFFWSVVPNVGERGRSFMGTSIYHRPANLAHCSVSFKTVHVSVFLLLSSLSHLAGPSQRPSVIRRKVGHGLS